MKFAHMLPHKKTLKFFFDNILYKIGFTPSVTYEGNKFYYQPHTDMGGKLYWIVGGNERHEIAVLKKC